MTTPTDPSNRIPEERVSAILKRAAELDRKVQESVELDAIRAAAVEAGISLSAVDRALEEYAAGTAAALQPVTPPSPTKPGWRRWWDKLNAPRQVGDLIKYGALGAVAGLIPAMGEAGLVAPMLALFLAALRIILQDRPTGRARRFVKCIGMMTLTSLTVYMASGDADEDVIAYTMMVAATLLPIGLLAIKTQARKPQPLAEVEPTS